MAGGHAWQGACMVGGMHGGGCVAGGHAWQEACMTGGVCMTGEGACVAGEMATAAGGTHPTGMHSSFTI